MIAQQIAQQKGEVVRQFKKILSAILDEKAGTLDVYSGEIQLQILADKKQLIGVFLKDNKRINMGKIVEDIKKEMLKTLDPLTRAAVNMYLGKESATSQLIGKLAGGQLLVYYDEDEEISFSLKKVGEETFTPIELETLF